MRINETIIVEGRDDTTAIKRSVDALTIETHGYGIRPETWDLIAKANDTTGIIIFTDPDHAGEQIRKRILKRFPEAGEAFLDRGEAEKNGDIGIENAEPESIRNALESARICIDKKDRPEDNSAYRPAADVFTADDMFSMGLAGCRDSAARRQALGKTLRIGFANSKTFMARLNKFGITRKEIEEEIRKL